MKKIFAIAAVVALALTSCVKNEGAFVANDNEIGFKNFTTTKALIATGGLPTTEKFGVFAFYKASADWATGDVTSAFMNDVEISYQTDVWKATTGKYFWPNSGYLSFFAYYPSSQADKTTYTADGLKVVGFNCGSTVGSQIDLMVTAGTLNVDCAAKTTSNSAVAVAFKHVLTKIALKFKQPEGASEDSKIVIKNITLKDFYIQGDYANKYPYDQTDNWTNVSTKTTFVVYSNVTGTTLTSTAQQIGEPIVVVAQATSGDDNTQKIEIDATITDGNGFEYDTTLTIDPDNDLNEGKSVNYDITIDAEKSTAEITFTPTVEDWTADDITENM